MREVPVSTKKWLVVVAVTVLATSVLFGYLPVANLIPLAFLLICPIAMWFMMKGMGGMGGMGVGHGDAASQAAPPRDNDPPATSQPTQAPVDPSIDSQYRR
jgi:Protein of unknown function (DUF2933)